MKFEPMHKIYYKQASNWQRILDNRRNSESSISLPIPIHEYNRRNTYDAFFMYHPVLVQLLLSLEAKRSAFINVVAKVPNVMILHVMNTFLSTEIKASNDIEGVYSSRKEIKAAIENSENDTLRFSSIIAKYRSILDNPHGFKFESSQDIRGLFDDIISDEIDAKNQPDGKLFRRDSVDIVNHQDKIIHRGTLPESRIITELDQALEILNDEDLVLPIRVAIFHYYFGYIHPFYDGNGRTNRFISTAYLAKYFHPLVALRLSAVINNNKKQYYDAFKMTTSEINGGDVTTFVIAFISLIEKTIDSAMELLDKRINRLMEEQEKLKVFFSAEKITDSLLQDIYFLLLQARLFSLGAGISKAEIMNACGKSRGTIFTRFKQIPKEYLIKVKHGRTESFMLKMSILPPLDKV